MPPAERDNNQQWALKEPPIKINEAQLVNTNCGLFLCINPVAQLNAPKHKTPLFKAY